MARTPLHAPTRSSGSSDAAAAADPLRARRRQVMALTASAVALACAAALLPTMARAQAAWPTKPVRIVVPFAPGGTTDILARAMAPELSKAFGQQFIVDNRAAAGGNVGAEMVAKSPGDGYTLLMGTVGTHGINRALYAKLPYDPIKDFVPITLVAAVPNVMVMNADKAKAQGIHNVQDFIRVAKANPGKMNMAKCGARPGDFSVPNQLAAATPLCARNPPESARRARPSSPSQLASVPRFICAIVCSTPHARVATICGDAPGARNKAAAKADSRSFSPSGHLPNKPRLIAATPSISPRNPARLR